MKLLPIYLIFTLLCVSCTAQTPAPPASPTIPAPPSTASLKDLHWQLRDLLRMQLPTTLPDQKGGKKFKKSYSLDYKWSDEVKDFVIELPEKQHDTITDAVNGGSKYLLPFQHIDRSGIRLTVSEDQRLLALTIPALPDRSFVYRPYSNAPDSQVTSITIGWYERVQERTLGRGEVLLRQFLEKMEAEKKQK